jgi:hypothetical protein
LLGVGSDVLEDLSRVIVVVDLLLEELREASDVLNLSSARELLNNTNDIAHDVLSLVVCNVRHVLKEDLSQLVDKWVNLADNIDWGPDNKAMQDAKTLNHAFLSRVLETLDSSLNCKLNDNSLWNFLNQSFNEAVSRFSHRDTFINLVFEATKIYLFNKCGIDGSKLSCLLLDNVYIRFD